jgi:hypothetical protein
MNVSMIGLPSVFHQLALVARLDFSAEPGDFDQRFIHQRPSLAGWERKPLRYNCTRGKK